ncbi:hypothetical protein B566_EDAN018072 [Ephemera danica]|nr:hypothetical protein B566_EDAN018072 [Ephemera danica]
MIIKIHNIDAIDETLQASSGAEDRLQVRGSSASSPAGSPPASAAAAAQPFLALPTTPVLLVPYQLVQAASLVSSHALPPGAATAPPGSCLLLVDGAIRQLTLPTCSLAPPPPVTAGVAAPPPPPPTQRPQPQVEQQTL